MPYKKKTLFFGIPIPGSKDTIQSAEEEKGRNIIENQLLASTKGLRCAVFEEGHFNVIDNHDGTYSVALSQARGVYALCGIVGGGYVESKDPILWDNLDGGTSHYLYVQYTEGMYANPEIFRTVSSITAKDDTNNGFLLMASVDLSGKEPTINTAPDGKIYSSDIVSNAMEKKIYTDIITGGTDGVSFTVPNANEILFVNYMRTSNDAEKGLGEINFQFNKSTLTMYNASVGIKLRLQIFYK